MQPVNVKRTRTIAQARAFLSFRYDENARSGFHSSVTKERYISRNLGAARTYFVPNNAAGERQHCKNYHNSGCESCKR